jgi:type II secretory pathway pseudopilin PulG
MNVSDEYAGQTGPCSACGKTIAIPKGGSPFTPGAQPARGSGTSLIVILAVALGGAVVCCGILAALLLPAVQAARGAARRQASMNNLKQISIALHNYHDTYGSFPPAVVKDENGNPLYSGRVLLLPFMEQVSLYEAFDKTKAWNAPENTAITTKALKVFEDPNSASTKSPRTDYLFVTGPGTIFEELPSGRPVRFADVTDGTSNTIYIIETAQANAHWAEPKDLDVSQLGSLPPGSHPSGTLAGFTDGSVRSLDKNIPPGTLRALLTRNGGEAVSY